MKHLITMMACIMVLLALLSQLVQNQQILLQLESGSHAIDQFCEYGDEAELKKSLCRIMDCEIEEVSIEQRDDVWIITVPIKKVLAAPEFWGINPNKNEGVYQWERRIRHE